MTEKRFTNHITKTDADGTIHSDGILDANEDNKIIITNYFYIASLLNKLNDENEKLKSNIDIRDKAIIELKEENKDLNDLLASKEDILLKPVIKIIDDKISEYKKYDGYDTEAYYIGTQLLKELRKEILK